MADSDVSQRPTQLLAIYIHFPWCLAKCPYCDFTSYAAERPAIDHGGYADAVLRELDARVAAFQGRSIPYRLNSVFFGGGTPSLWEPKELGRVLHAVFAAFGARALAPEDSLEVTAECNPSSLDEARAHALRDAGVTRLSVGVQALDDRNLQFLGRLHDSAGGLRALRNALKATPHVSSDWIFGLPGQTPEEALDELAMLMDLPLEHMSAYQLTVEPSTMFGALARKGRLPLADDGLVAETFHAVSHTLCAAGYRHYEISNFAKPGRESQHNLGYWMGLPYLGLGCGAVGCLECMNVGAAKEDTVWRVRYRNSRSPENYMATWRDRPEIDDPLPMTPWTERLDGETLLRERIMLGLRLDAGLDLERAGQACGVVGMTQERQRALDALAQKGRIVQEGSRVRIPKDAWLWTDDTAARLM